MSTDKGKLAVMLGPLVGCATFVHSFVGSSEAKRGSCLAKEGQSDSREPKRFGGLRYQRDIVRYMPWHKMLPGLLF